MLDGILLWVLKNRLKRYKQDAKWYVNINNYNNWYHEWGIPKLINEIDILEKKINHKPSPPNECYEQFGLDLDGCSTQEERGCVGCRLYK